MACEQATPTTPHCAPRAQRNVMTQSHAPHHEVVHGNQLRSRAHWTSHTSLTVVKASSHISQLGAAERMLTFCVLFGRRINTHCFVAVSVSVPVRAGGPRAPPTPRHALANSQESSRFHKHMQEGSISQVCRHEARSRWQNGCDPAAAYTLSLVPQITVSGGNSDQLAQPIAL